MNDYDRIAEMQRGWTPPPELGNCPREIRLSRLGIFLVALGGVFALGALAALIAFPQMAAASKKKLRTLQEQGVNTKATVTRLWRTSGKDERHMVAYEFPHEGNSYRTQVSAPIRIWRGLTNGAEIEVRFVPSNPALNHPTGWSQSSGPPAWLGGLLAPLLLIAPVLLFVIVQQQMALLSEGRAAPAVITGYVQSDKGKHIRYEFPLSDGSIAKGRSGPSSKAPPIGTIMCVLYDRDNPRRNARYPLELVRLAPP